MLTVANYQEAPDASAQIDQAVQDEQLEFSEIQNLSELPAEMQATILNRMWDELQLTEDIATQLSDVTPDVDNPSPEQKQVQFVLDLHEMTQWRRLRWGLDGQIGTNTIALIKEIVPSYEGGVITPEIMTSLISATNARITERSQAVAAEAQEREQQVSQAHELLAQYSDIEEVQALNTDDRIAFQEALNLLGFDTNWTRGGIWPASTSAFEDYQQTLGDAERRAAAQAAADALEQAVAQAWLNSVAVVARQGEVLSESEYTQLQLNASQAQSDRESIEEKVRNWYTNDFDLDQDVSSLSLADAQAAFNIAQENYGRASEDGTLAERVEDTWYNVFSENDDNYFEAALNLARVQERVANENLEAENASRLAAGLAVTNATQAQAEVTRLQGLELDAYIDVLTDGWAHAELTALLESNPEEVRAVIEGMREMTPEAILGLREALAYFGDTGSHLSENEITGDLVVAVVNMSSDIFTDQPGEQLTLDSWTANMINTIHMSYLARAAHIGDRVRLANVRWGLDTGMNALGAILGISVWYPDADLVDASGVRGQIPNGLRGRMIIEKDLIQVFQHDYRNVTTHRSTRDHTGETISYDGSTTSDPVYWRTRLVEQRLQTTGAWFSLSAAGADRERISWLISQGAENGGMDLELSRSAIDRIYDINPETGALEEESWYTALREYKDALVDIDDYTDDQWVVDYTAYHDAQAEAATDTSVDISSQTLSAAMLEVSRENPDRYAEIMTENEADFLALDDISFGLRHAERGNRSEDTYIMWGVDQETGRYTIGVFNAATWEVTQRQEFETKEERMNSELGQQALTLSSYRYLGVVTENTEGGLRMADDQGLVRCSDQSAEQIVLLNTAPPVLAEGYNFLRNGLPCGILGALCNVTVRNSERDRTYTSTEFDPTILPRPRPEPDGDWGWDNDGGWFTSTPGGGWTAGTADTGGVADWDSGNESSWSNGGGTFG